MAEIVDYYQILGVAPTATVDQIKKAYCAKAMKAHPDRGGTHEAMVLVAEAAEVLLNPESRRVYDEFRAGTASRTTLAIWKGVQQSAHVVAAAYPTDWEAFQGWLARASGSVQSTAGGRVLAGIVAGALAGAILGAIAGSIFGAGLLFGSVIGVLIGGVAGMVAGANSSPHSTGS